MCENKTSLPGGYKGDFYFSSTAAGSNYHYVVGLFNCFVNDNYFDTDNLYVKCVKDECDGLLPTFTNVTANPTTICNGGSTTLTATASGAASFSFDNGSSWQTANTVSVSPTSTTTYMVKVRSSASCEAAEQKVVVVTVNTPPTAPTDLNSSTTTICNCTTTFT
jgi:hypothetical protein